METASGSVPDVRSAPDVYSAQCPCRSILDRIADKWTALIIGKLDQQPQRFNQLRREIPGVSQKVLTHTLRALERDGIVHRQAYPTVPTTVVYSLTDLGDTLAEPLNAVREWAQSHRSEVVEAREKYDHRPKDSGRMGEAAGVRAS